MNMKFYLTTLIFLCPVTETYSNSVAEEFYNFFYANRKVDQDRRVLLAVGCSVAVVSYLVYKYYKNLEHDDSLNSSDATQLNNNIKKGSEHKDNVDSNALDDDKVISLHQAIMYRSVSEVKKLLRNGANLDITDNVWGYPLHSAISYFGDAEIVKLLLEYGADIEARDKFDKSTALHKAVKDNNLKIVEMLLSQGAYVNAKNIDGITPLQMALESKNLLIIKAFIVHIANEHTLMEDGITRLHAAVASNLFETVQMLIAHKVDVNAKLYSNGMTPLHLALCGYNIEIATKIVKELLIHHAKVNDLDKDGNTPLHLAVSHFWSDGKDIILMLLEHGANVHAQNNDGNTPLHLAFLQRSDNILPLLLEYGACINAQNKEGNTKLHLAVLQKNYHSIRILLENNADLTIKNNAQKTARDCALDQGLTPLRWAVILQDTKEIAQLLAQGDDINEQDIDGNTPLHCASTMNSVETVKFLISQNANVNTVNSSGLTPLHFVLFCNKNHSIDIAEELIAAGADVNAIDNRNATVLDFALCFHADEEVIALLKRHGARSRT